MADKEIIDEIVANTDIVALVSKYVNLEKRGKNYIGLCPFHSEKTPSFTVSPEKHLAKCFGCGGGGTAIDFIMRIENLDFPHALKYLADFNGMNVNLNIRENDTKQNNKKYYEIMNTAVSFYKKVLHNTKEGKDAINYLVNRGLSPEEIDKLNIGLSLDIGDNLYHVLIESGYKELDIEDLGLISKNERGYYDMFSNRIMFPIYDENNNPIAFSGRIYRDIDKDNAKYINTKETIIFKKKEELFNLNNARNEIRLKDRVILHEGQMDVLASFQGGLPEAVCSLGTALNKEAVLKLKRYTTNVIICYDGDKAGINASIKAIKLFETYGFNVKLVLMPDGSDPDEYQKKYGLAKYNEFFNNNIIEKEEYLYRILFLNKNLNDIPTKENIKNEAFSFINDIRSQTLVNEYLNRLAKDLKFDVKLIIDDFKYYKNTHPSSNGYRRDDVEPIEPVYNDVIDLKKPKTFYSICEYRLFIYARSQKEKALYIDNMIKDIMNFGFSYNTQVLWIKLINDYYMNYDYYDEAIFLKMLNQEEVTYLLNLIEEVRKDNTPYNDLDLNECILKIKEISYTKEIEDISSRLHLLKDDLKKIALVSKQYELKRKLKELKESRKKNKNND